MDGRQEHQTEQVDISPAEQDADLEWNLLLLARELLPAYHDGAPQYC